MACPVRRIVIGGRSGRLIKAADPGGGTCRHRRHTLPETVMGLSVQQPLAEMILTGQKKLEVRAWRTAYRGPLLIVSCRRPVYFKLGDEYLPADAITDPRQQPARPLPSGVAVCLVELTDIFRPRPADARHTGLSDLEFTSRDWAWRLCEPRAVQPVPIKGRLGLFPIQSGIVEFTAVS